MKIKFLIVFFLAAAATLIAAQTVVESLTAKSEGDSIVVEWRSASESGITSFEIERAGKDNLFQHVDNVSPRGDGSHYRFVDDEVYFKDKAGPRDKIQQKTQYSYRLKVVFADNTYAYSDVVYVAHQVSSIRRTWGMIKEMFR
ncbi:MAG: hypothetical protein ACLFQX_07595 [Candidatus Kapaibacterium sp.]